MLNVLFRTTTGLLSLACIVLAAAMVVALWVYFIRKSNEKN